VANIKAVFILSDLPGPRLDVACRKCARRGRLSVSRLLSEHGDIGLPELASRLPGDCPKRTALPEHDRCSIYYPSLVLK
jgi:hypothetical protein